MSSCMLRRFFFSLNLCAEFRVRGQKKKYEYDDPAKVAKDNDLQIKELLKQLSK